MKKVLAVALALIMVLSFAACGDNTEQGSGAIEMKVVKGVTIPEFKIKVCGAKVTNADMAAYDLYEYTAETVNSSGNANSKVYVGFKMTDVLEAAQVSGELGKYTVIATDDYTVEFADGLNADEVLLAVTEDGKQFKEGPWFAPCASKTTGDFGKNIAKIEIEGGSSPLAGGSKDDGGNKGSDEVIDWPQDPVAEDKTDKITFKDFVIKVNGKEVKNADLEGLKIWRITVTTKNSKEKVSQDKYSGYVLSEVLAKLGISAGKVTVVANDGYTTELTAEQLADPLTIIAIEKNKEMGEGGTFWLAPCSENTSGAYAKGVVEIKAE